MALNGVKAQYGAVYDPNAQNLGAVSYFGLGSLNGQAAYGLSSVPATATLPETLMNLYLRNSMLLGNTINGQFGLTDNALAWAGRNGHMGRYEMRLFNDTMGLGMDKATRKAFRRSLNGKRLKAGQQSLINLYYAGLNNRPTPQQLQLIDQSNEARNAAFKKAWEEHAATLGPKASDDFNKAMAGISSIAALQNYLGGQAGQEGATWSANIGTSGLYDKQGQADGIYGKGTNALAQAYYNTLDAGNKAAFRKKMEELGGLSSSKWGKGFSGQNVLTGFTAPEAYKPTEEDFNGWYQDKGADIWRADYSNPAKREMASLYQAAGLSFKQGGNLNMNKIKYYLEGGAMSPAQAASAQGGQDIQTQVAQLVQAAMGGDELATQTIQLIMQAALQGDQQAAQIAQMIQEIAQLMQGQAQAAKRGAKLSYLRSLKSGCPEGTEAKYYKKGGHICKECVRKACGGTKTMKAQNGTDIEAEKCGGKAKKKYITGGPAVKPINKQNKQPLRLDPNNTPKLPGGKYPTYWTASERRAWERKYGTGDEGAASTDPILKLNLQKKLAKKNANGGLLTLENILSAYKFANGGNIPKFYGGGYASVGRAMLQSTTGGRQTPLRKTTKGRFLVKDKKGKVIATYDTKEKALDHSYALYGGRNATAYGAVSEAPALQKTQQTSGRLTAQLVALGSKRATEKFNSKPGVLKAKGTATKNRTTKSFKAAFDEAAARGDLYFEWDGKGYTTDQKQKDGSVKRLGTNDNKMALMYGSNGSNGLGGSWGYTSKDGYGEKSAAHMDLQRGGSEIRQQMLEENAKSGGPTYSKVGAGWNLYDGWTAQDYKDLSDKTAKVGAGVAAAGMAPMVLMEAAPGLTYNLANGVQTIGDGASWAAREGWQGAKDAVSGLRLGNLLGNNLIASNTGNYANLGSEISNGARMGALPTSFVKHVPEIVPRPAGPIIPSNAASAIAKNAETMGWLVNGNAKGILGTGMLVALKQGGKLYFH